MDWSKYAPEFQEHEFRCSHCGHVSMQVEFMDLFHELRTKYARPIMVTSGYRCPDHPIERDKLSKSGAHALGCAVDIAVFTPNAFDLVELAMGMGFTGIGIKQSGDIRSRFIHIDTMPRDAGRALWSYA